MNKRLALVGLFNALVLGTTLWSERQLSGAPRVTASARKAGRVLAIIPARNEERNIERAVGSLLVAAERYGPASVLVVDDGSTDQTAERLLALRRTHPLASRLEVLHLEGELPEGWLGKPRACWAGAQAAPAQDAEWLLFVDADTEASEELIERTVAGALETQADLLSIFPHQELGGVAERLIMPHLFYVLAVGFPWRAVNDPTSTLAIANGQCILVRRSAYEAVGGHRAVRGAIAEDKALAETVKGAGYRLHLADGRDLMRTRMYTSLAEVWEGWSKNAYLGLGDRAYLLWVAVALGLAVGVLPFVVLPLALRKRRRTEAAVWALTLAVVLRNRVRAMDEFDVPRWYAATLPIGTLLCSGIAVTAWARVVSGRGVTWKGRRYASRASGG